jgi:hypothetical protein
LSGLGGLVVDLLGGLPRLVSRLLGGIPGAAGRIFGLLPRVVRGLLSGAGSWFAPLLAAVGRFFGGRGVLMGVFRWFAGRAGIGAIFGPAGAVLSILLQFADRIYAFSNEMGLKLHGLWGRMLEPIFGGTFVERFYRGFQGAVQGFVDWTVDIERVVAGWARGFGEWIGGLFEWVGESTVFGWTKGVWDNVQGFWDMLVDMAKQALDHVKRALGISSPSKEAEWQSEMLMEGYLNPVRRGAGRMRDAMAKVRREMVLDLGRGGGGFDPDRIVARVPMGSRPRVSEAHSGVEAAYARAMRVAERATDGRLPVRVVVHNYLGNEKIDERVIEVVGEREREIYRSGFLGAR